MNGHKIINQNSIHFVTFTIVGWIDVFTRKDYKDIIIDSLLYCHKNKGLNIHAYVIMSNHLHLILSCTEGYRLSDVIRDFKKYTSKTIIKTILENPKESRSEWMLKLLKYFAKYNKNNTTFQLWQRNNRPIELISPKWINQKLAYIHLNPVRTGLVLNAENYIYSSAGQYIGNEGLVPIMDILTENTDNYGAA